MNPMAADGADKEHLWRLACFSLKNEDLPDFRRKEERIAF
tara:strand:- start:4 stop:123 length:120 start_codon:yes stop_codon:yes gene_type:complete